MVGNGVKRVSAESNEIWVEKGEEKDLLHHLTDSTRYTYIQEHL